MDLGSDAGRVKYGVVRARRKSKAWFDTGRWQQRMLRQSTLRKACEPAVL